jgi:proteasome lid subunit RPN8/RPN11
MLQALVSTASRLFNQLNSTLEKQRTATPETREAVSAAAPRYDPLRRVILTDGVGRTLFEEYASHLESARSEEETGWLLLGLREKDQAVVLATLPAGTERDAGVGHVQFSSEGQSLGSRIVRQSDRRLMLLGVVHTHPGSLRHPSDGDFRGDSIWVGQLRGREGIFGIGNADSSPTNGTAIAHQPKPNVQCLGKLRFSWYALHENDRHYRPLPVELTLGPDLARPLHSVWSVIEAHAGRLDRLCRQQAGITFEVVSGNEGPALAARIPLAEPSSAIRVLMEGKDVQYFWLHKGQTYAVDPHEARVDRAVYLLLAELAAQVN